MDAKTLYTVLIIVGSFLSVGMLINGFFLKGIYDRLGNVEIGQAEIMNENKNFQRFIDEQKEINKDLYDKIDKIKGQL